jgi:hypothetical protein
MGGEKGMKGHCAVFSYIDYKKNKMSTDRESGRGNKRARVYFHCRFLEICAVFPLQILFLLIDVRRFWSD